MELLVIPILVIGAILIFGLAFWARYKTVSPDNAMIVTGSYLGAKNVHTDESGRKIKIVRGGGAFIIPIFQQQKTITLLSHKIDVSTPEVYTEQGVPIMADGVAIIKVGSSLEDVATAAEQFLGKPIETLKAEAQEVLEGHLRAILGTMTVEEIYKNRDKFAQDVQGVAALDLKKMGLSIVSFTIKDIRDKNGYLDALGKPRISAVKRDADIAQANAERDSRVQKAKAEEEAKKAELVKDTNVAEAEKDKELKIAAFKKEQDQAKAEADQSYAIQEAKSLQVVTEEEMKVQLVKKDKEIELQQKEILQKERQYDAEIKKKADAEAYALEKTAEANKTKKILEAMADAEQKRLQGQAVADAKRAEGTAEAEIIKAKSLAEADGKEALALAFEKFGQAAIIDAYLKVMPLMTKEAATAFSSIDKITVVDAGGGEGAMKVSNYLTNLLATAPQMVKDSTGIDFTQLAKAFIDSKNSNDVAGELVKKPATQVPTESAAPKTEEK